MRTIKYNLLRKITAQIDKYQIKELHQPSVYKANKVITIPLQWEQVNIKEAA